MDSQSHAAVTQNGTRNETPAQEHGTPELNLGGTGDRCVSCGAPLSSDQRYCVVCGERRGAPRFTLPQPAPSERRESETVSAARGRRLAPRSGFGVGVTLIAGVATLLLAMLVGVLIGHNTAKTTPVADTPAVHVNVTSTGSSAAPATSPGSTSTTATTPQATTHHHASAKTTSTPKAVKQQAKAEQGAASKVTGGNGAPPPTTKLGQKGKGAGFNKKTHKFDGSFFGQ